MLKLLICLCSILLPFVSVKASSNTPVNQVVVKDTLDLHGKKWFTKPDCIIKCLDSGLIVNGEIVGDNAIGKDLHVSNVSFSGMFSDMSLTLFSDVDSLFRSNFQFKSLKIEGRDHIVSNTQFGLVRDADVSIKNTTFDCSNLQSSFLYLISTHQNLLCLDNCNFTNIPEVDFLIPRGIKNLVIQNCSFTGTVNPDSKPTKTSVVVCRFYECLGKLSFESNEIRNCFGIAVDGIGFRKEQDTNISISNNIIDNVTKGGIVFNGGVVHNVVIAHNRISNVNCLSGKLLDNASSAENSAINLHGFNKLKITNNIITNVVNASAIELNGIRGNTWSGENVIITGNEFNTISRIVLLGIKEADMSENSFSFSKKAISRKSDSGLILNACQDLKIRKNVVNAVSDLNCNIYPFILRQNKNLKSGKISILDNKIRSNGKIYLMIYDGFTGQVIADNNDALSSTSNKSLKWVNNTKIKTFKVKDNNIYKK